MLTHVSPKQQPPYTRITFELRSIHPADLEAIAEFLGYRSLQEYAKEIFMARAIADVDRIIAQRDAMRSQAVVREVEAMLAQHSQVEGVEQFVLQETVV